MRETKRGYTNNCLSTKLELKPDNVFRQDTLNKLHLNVENRQYEVNAILNDFVSLEKEAKNDDLSRKVQDFKDRWLKLRSQLRLSVSHLPPFENSVSNRNGDSLGDGPGSTASVSSCETTHETQASRTTYYNSQVRLSHVYLKSAFTMLN